MTRIETLPAPMLPTLVDEPFDSPDWLFEIKWDGVRAICEVRRDGVRCVSRTGRDLTAQFPELLELRRSFLRLPVVVDGEIVSLDAAGRSSFQRLQPRINRLRHSDKAAVDVHYAVFDMLRRGNVDLREIPLEDRKSLLAAGLRGKSGIAMLSKHVERTGKKLFASAKRAGVEGIIAKQCDSPYVSGRSRNWLKIKTVLRQEFVIGGWTEPQGGRRFFGALLLGLYDGPRLTYVGHVGTGFDESTLADVHKRMAALEVRRSPFANEPQANTKAHWVKPKLVAEAKFSEWTRDGVLRQPVYLGLRIDKRPQDCVREAPARAPKGKR